MEYPASKLLKDYRTKLLLCLPWLMQNNHNCLHVLCKFSMDNFSLENPFYLIDLKTEEIVYLNFLCM